MISRSEAKERELVERKERERESSDRKRQTIKEEWDDKKMR